MNIQAKQLIKQAIVLRSFPANEYNPDPTAPKVQRKDADGRQLYSFEVMLLPATGGMPLTCWLTSAVQGNLPADGDALLLPDTATIVLANNRKDGKTTWRLTAPIVASKAGNGQAAA